MFSNVMYHRDVKKKVSTRYMVKQVLFWMTENILKTKCTIGFLWKKCSISNNVLIGVKRCFYEKWVKQVLFWMIMILF